MRAYTDIKFKINAGESGDNMYKRIYCFCILIFFSIAALAADYSTPTGRVKDTVESVISILKDKTMERDARWEKISAVIKNSFDFRSMSQSVLATNWKKATPEEQERFTEFFTQYIEETYRAKIEAYTDEKVLYKEETIRGNRATVETLIVTSSTEIPVDFRLRYDDVDSEWYAYDVVIEGISLVSNYRNTFAAIVKNEGMDGLLSDIQRRINKYKEEQAAQQAAAGSGG